MAVDSKQAVSGKKARVKKSSQKHESKPDQNAAKRNKTPGIRIVGGRIYDPVNGKTCHQCRQKTRDFVAACRNQSKNKPCPIMYCHKCLLNRYGEQAAEVDAQGEWTCPKCRGICNCSICMKKRGHQPTGMLINMAKATGFSSVSEMLSKGEECLNHENVSVDTVASPKKGLVPSPKKRQKEDSFDGKADANPSNHIDKKSKKLKRDKVYEMRNGINGEEMLEGSSVRDEKKLKKSRKNELESDDMKKNNAFLARRTSPRKLKVSNGMPNRGAKLDMGVDADKNMNDMITLAGNELIETLENDKRKEEVNTASYKIAVDYDNVDLHADIPLPPGIELNSVGGIDVRTEDVGSALQFLEFCAVFAKILSVKKGQPEYVLQDLLQGRTARRGKYSLAVQFHIHLLSILLTERGEECATLSPHGENSWFQVLKKCLSDCLPKEHVLDSLEKAADYETLEASEKLKLLNILCDEILGTEKVRNWMDAQNTKFAEKIKEAKQKLTAAKDKEKSLKQRMKDDIAKAIVARHGAPLSISEHEAIVSRIKRETERAHAKVLESKGMFLKSNQTSDSMRIEPIFKDHNGQAYWKLNCSGKSDVLCQKINAGKGNTLTLDEKWFAMGDEGKEALENHICSFKGKGRLKGCESPG